MIINHVPVVISPHDSVPADFNLRELQTRPILHRIIEMVLNKIVAQHLLLVA